MDPPGVPANPRRSVGQASAATRCGSARRPPICWPSLNEGRSSSPGDTQSTGGVGEITGDAQRRPELKPRRHPSGTSTPPPCADPLNEGRSSSPGDTPAYVRSVIRHAVRSTKAGAQAPATPNRPAALARSRATLNEGRSSSPGDTRLVLPHRRRVPIRSTKAGAQAPATRPRMFGASSGTPYAQRRPELKPRRHMPSGRPMKVGPNFAQRRPELKPRRHTAGRCSTPGPRWSLNEGRSPSPGDTRRKDDDAVLRALRSTKAGAQAPATLLMQGTIPPARKTPYRQSSKPVFPAGLDRASALVPLEQ